MPGPDRSRWWQVPWVMLLVAVSACAPASIPQEAPKELPPPPVTAAQVQQREVTIEQTYVGTVMPVRISTVSSPVEGRVVEFLVNEGDYVKAKKEREEQDGQEKHEVQQQEQVLPLARLRTESLQIELAAAEAELKVRQHELEELKLSAPKEIDQAKARMEAARSLMELTQSRLKRTREVYGRGAASDDELEEHQSAAEAAEKAYLEKKAAWELVAETDYWQKRIDQADARVKVQQETVKRLQDDLAQHEIYAPFDGYVTQEHTEVGQWLAKGDPIAEVVELKYVDVEVPVLESYVSQLRPPLLFHVGANFQDDLENGALSVEFRQEFENHGISLSEDATVTTEKESCQWRISDKDQSYTVTKREVLEVYRPGTAARVEIAALPDRQFQGEVVAIVPKADVRSRSFPVKVRLENPENPADPNELVLKPGMFARVTLPAKKRKMLLVPKDALVLEEALSAVWVVEPESKGKPSGPGTVKKKVPVEVEKSSEDWIEVLGPLDEDGSLPLQPGEWVVVEGNERVGPGPVNIVKTWH